MSAGRLMLQRLWPEKKAVAARRAFLSMGLALLAGAATAQTVYRCGPQGRSYSQLPCDDGRPVDVGDMRSPQQHEEAEAQRRRLTRQASELPERQPEAPRGAGLIHTRTPPPDPVSIAAQPSAKVKGPSTARPRTRKTQPLQAAEAGSSASTTRKRKRIGGS